MANDAIKTRTIIGLEIHVQLLTKSKMFCGCPVVFDAPPNTCVCPVCLGHPGALPVVNRKAFELSVLTGMALNCSIARYTKWDRKSYYYPDMPKNYQISQYDLPLASEGFLEFPVNGSTKRIRIRRAHLEEDAGKNTHSQTGTLVDLNRAGTPLLEIVTEPDLTSAEDAYQFCTELQKLVTYLGVSEGVMKKGQMRFEPNVNVEIELEGKEYKTPISEIKNLNSFRAVRDAIAYDSKRQIDVWLQDHDYVIGRAPNENRGWNADKGVTEFQRTKEAAHDYRYFPDPDLLPVEMTEAMIDTIRQRLPELPIERRKRFVSQYGLPVQDAETIVQDRAIADMFEQVVQFAGSADVVGKQFVNVWLKLANDREVNVTQLGVDADRMADLAKIVSDGTINKSAVAKIAEVMVDRAEPHALACADENSPEPQASACASIPGLKNTPISLAEELGLLQVTDTGTTQEWVNQAIAANAQAVEDALKNPKKTKAAIGFLRGQVMKLSGGKADPKLVGQLIEKHIKERST